MNLRGLGAAVLAIAALPALSGCVLPPDTPSVLASASGTGPGDAYAVSSEAQEHEILTLLGLELQIKEVHQIDGRAYDVLIAKDLQTQETREVWFDISRFFLRN